MLILLSSFLSLSIRSEDTIAAKAQRISHVQISHELKLSVYLPLSYGEHSSKTKSYPVLYILDGERFFYNGVAYQSSLAHRAQIPEMIVVGVELPAKLRRTLFTSEKNSLSAQLQSKIIPFIDNKYRTSSQRLIFGWEVAATFVLESMANSPELFDAYFAISPTQIGDNLHKRIQSGLKDISASTKFAYVGISRAEPWSIPETNEINKAFNTDPQSRAKGFEWHYLVAEEGNHYSTSITLFFEGLQRFYREFVPIRFYSIAEFEKFGGLNAVAKHYERRGQRFLQPIDVHLDTIHYLLNQSVKEDSIDTFMEIVSTYPQFIRSYYTRDFWFERYRGFLLKHQKQKLAIGLLD